jgi:hypothetical protein
MSWLVELRGPFIFLAERQAWTASHHVRASNSLGICETPKMMRFLFQKNNTFCDQEKMRHRPERTVFDSSFLAVSGKLGSGRFVHLR